MNVRTALLYPKSFATLIEESVRLELSYNSGANHIIGNKRPPANRANLLDGGLSTLKISTAYIMLGVRILGTLQVSEMRIILL